ncbi:hypothetical protein Cylst_3397 [Cylindrospermum stagnale PCC 7417]|uniref:eCIS core domain-containing protein n=1 Tax=Cylindrospermum stagnale PCC 7417 TaxID=56107 RepID=K9X1C7_9NOST|nr:DUF4157 domain-containing protein [Cylindrospermum stagnale]AFZ25547.1 hypothetical protein Cylst_3397 [Cylindrospermum stagnale PCC 7417]
MYSREHRTAKSSSNSSDRPAANQFAPRRFVVQPKTEEVSPVQDQTPDAQAKAERLKEVGHSFLDGVKLAPRSTPAKTPRIQMKLSIGQPGDKYEQEADKMAQDVVQRISAPESESVQRQTPEEEEPVQAKSLSETIQRQTPEEEEVQAKSLSETIQRQTPEEEEVQAKSLSETIQRQTPEEEEPVQAKSMVQRVSSEGGTAATPDIEESIQQAKGSGQPLAENVREPMEKAFGADFSGVKVHTDSKSDQLNQSIQARAFTTGQDLFFRGGEYNPGSKGGQELIAHELTHVVQQTGAVQRKGKMGAGTSRTLDFITMKRKHIQLTGDDKYGHWWTEIDGGESYGWWPKYHVGLKGTLFGVEGELNGMTSFGGSSTKDPHHGDSAEQFHPVYTGSKTNAAIKADIRSFASSYSGQWRWTFGFGQNCHTFQKSLMNTIGIKES